MFNEFTGIIEKDGDWYISYCSEVSGANGQDKTIEECKMSLASAIYAPIGRGRYGEYEVRETIE